MKTKGFEFSPHGGENSCCGEKSHRKHGLLSSADFDATSLLTVVLSGDGRLLDLLRHQDLIPLCTRIRTRLNTESATRDELLELLAHALAKAGNATLMTDELMDVLVDHAAGNYRLLMTMSAELLAYGIAHEVSQLDEKRRRSAELTQVLLSNLTHYLERRNGGARTTR